MIRQILKVSLLLALAVPLFASAEDRVLLIGVGEYADSAHNLDGIDLDVQIMSRVARNIGFEESEIKTLVDADATVANVDRAMSTWLVDGVESEDRVLIYFSGHGTQLKDTNGDESDGVDEALAMHDLAFVDGSLNGVLVDDRFYELLSNIPSNNVYLIVDACHSGTGYRTIDDAFTGAKTAQAKSYRYAGMPSKIVGGFTYDEKDSGPQRFAALMAAADDEQSLATRSGSMFTLALADGVDRAVEAREPVTLRDLQHYATGIIKAALEQSAPERIFTPQLDGEKRLVDMPMQVTSAPSRRNQLMEIAQAHPGIVVSANKSEFAIGDISLKIDVMLPQDGYLNIVAVNPDDQAVVLFPNAFNPDNAVSDGQMTLPTAQMSFDFKAAKPVGDTEFFAFLSRTPVDLYESGLGEQDESGDVKRALLAKLSALGTRSIEVVARDEALLAGSMSISVIE